MKHLHKATVYLHVNTVQNVGLTVSVFFLRTVVHLLSCIGIRVYFHVFPNYLMIQIS